MAKIPRNLPGFLLILVVLFLAASCISPQQEYPMQDQLKSSAICCDDSLMITAHRGGAGLAPENTLAAFTSGIEHAADALEMDIHLTSDGNLVVVHDPTLARTTGKSVVVETTALADIKKLDAAAKYFGKAFGPQQIPTLEEVLELNDGRLWLQIEIKLRSDGTRYPGIEQRLLQTLESYRMLDRVIVISFDFPTLKTIKELNSAVLTGALAGKAYLSSVGANGPAEVVRQIHASGADYVGISHSYLSDTLYKGFREAGLGVGVWTVNTREDMRKYIDLGVDFITTDRPDLLRHCL
ncbi:MAG: glycerophosphodiester phosphodiesterase [Spirochaetia bacterium]|nr:glycerophosphodiester phosphodiesterase [Spirochaetia bacterium]